MNRLVIGRNVASAASNEWRTNVILSTPGRTAPISQKDALVPSPCTPGRRDSYLTAFVLRRCRRPPMSSRDRPMKNCPGSEIPSATAELTGWPGSAADSIASALLESSLCQTELINAVLLTLLDG